MIFDNIDLVTRDGYKYKFNPSACKSCGGACCTGESGYIWVKYQEIEKMAQFLELTIEEFATMYLRKVKHRYSIIEKKLDTDNYACIFFDNSIKQCKIYPVRPSQCRTFPFWEIFKKDIEEVKKECPGIID
ncbi:MAG: YkgJ family cysteine cluster protein [Sulfurovaceae bacterium]|nr:YkgJ family cysteine cluster protein [Sulfurovaceae bacterium]